MRRRKIELQENQLRKKERKSFIVNFFEIIN